MPYDWIDAHRGNIPQINREDADQSDADKAIAEDRARSLHVPGIKPGKLASEPDAARGAPAAVDPRGLVFDEDGNLRSVEDKDFEPPKRAHAPATADKK